MKWVLVVVAALLVWTLRDFSAERPLRAVVVFTWAVVTLMAAFLPSVDRDEER
ncbi:hypothetical protein [Deinococcus pimensis]|uniref:hypothetical protein n=1 Tax=Deinococcus pimensis TaxID=309888 RepID=UPI0012FCB5F1|nr:hypothetical protein [Deinococcus pimensis]